MLTAFLAVLSFAAGPAWAQCVEPTPPPTLDGATATEDQLRTAMAQARDFVAQSNIFQACLTSEMEAAKSQPDADKTALEAIEQDTQARIAANQRLKEKVTLEAGTIMDTYKKSHAD